MSKSDEIAKKKSKLHQLIEIIHEFRNELQNEKGTTNWDEEAKEKEISKDQEMTNV